MVAYSKKFDVNIDRFDFVGYFGHEGIRFMDIIRLPLYLFGLKRLKTLYVKDLLRGIIEKELHL